MNIVIRKAELHELPELIEFEQGIIKAERPFDNSLRQDYFHYYDIAELIESDKAEVIVAAHGDKLVASGYVKIAPSKHFLYHTEHAFLGFMYVDENYRGKGINQMIVDALIAWAKQRGLTEVHLEVYPGNTPAIKAYEKAGFAPYLLNMRKSI